MTGRERTDIVLDAKELRDEVVDVWREVDEQLGMRLRRERGGIGSCGHQAVAKRCIPRAEKIEEHPVQARQRLTVVKVLEAEAEVEIESSALGIRHGGGVVHGDSCR